MISGTPAYLAPEVARGEQPDAASDVFSLGATIYSAIEGESVFGPSDNSFGLIYRAASGQLRDPKNAGELTPLLNRLLAVDANQRPTAQEAADLLAAEPQPSQPLPVPAQRALKPPNRRILVILSVIAALAIGGGAAAAYWNGTNTDTPTSRNNFPASQNSFPTGERARYFTAEEAIVFVQQHYADLPGNPTAAWQHFSTQVREPQADFLKRWKGYTSVTCTLSTTPVHSNAGNWVVTVDLALVTDLNKRRNITVQVLVAAVDNEMKIAGLTEIG
jgi:eukaryotic-like serine/threonine-protein kinase